jgi:hypothetical protein
MAGVSGPLGPVFRNDLDIWFKITGRDAAAQANKHNNPIANFTGRVTQFVWMTYTP